MSGRVFSAIKIQLVKKHWINVNYRVGSATLQCLRYEFNSKKGI